MREILENFKDNYSIIIKNGECDIFSELCNKLLSENFVTESDIPSGFKLYSERYLTFVNYFNFIDIKFYYDKNLKVAYIKRVFCNVEYDTWETKILIFLRIQIEEIGHKKDIPIKYGDIKNGLIPYFDDAKSKKFDKKVCDFLDVCKKNNLVYFKSSDFSENTIVTLRKTLLVAFGEEELNQIKNSMEEWRRESK